MCDKPESLYEKGYHDLQSVWGGQLQGSVLIAGFVPGVVTHTTRVASTIFISPFRPEVLKPFL